MSVRTYTELGRIGNNINQLTHLAHLAQLEGHSNLPDSQVLIELNDLLHQVRREIAVGSLQDDDEEAEKETEEIEEAEAEVNDWQTN